MGKIQESSKNFYLPFGVDGRTILGVEEISLSSNESIICKTIKPFGQKQLVTPVCVAREYLGVSGNMETYRGRPCRRKDLIAFSQKAKSGELGELDFTAYQKTMLRGYLW